MYYDKTIQNYCYNTRDLIGQGFSSVVYRGRNLKTGEIVSIKVVQKSLQEQVQMLIYENEIKTLSQIQGRNILKFYDTFQTPNNIYIITEYCRQGDLAQMLKQGEITQECCIKCIRQVIEGLEIMFAQNFIHRDLKPSNILICEGIIKIADFGFAKQLSELKNEMNLGTPLYMSPELLMRNEYNEKTDVWSLGVMFYELLFGVTPWKVNTEQELIFAIHNQAIDYRGINASIQDFISKCLTFDVNQRLAIPELIEHPLFKRRKVSKTAKTESDSIEKQQPPKRLLVKQNLVRDIVMPIKSSKKFLGEKIISAQILYAAFIKQFVDSFDFNIDTPFLKQKFKYLMLKHRYLLAKRLKRQVENNLMKLANWEEFTKQDRFQLMQRKVLQFESESIEDFQSYVEELRQDLPFQNEIIHYDHQFNMQFLMLDNPKFVQAMLKFLKQIIIEYNHLLAQQFTLMTDDLFISKHQNAISCLEKLLVYHYLLKNFKTHSEQAFFEENALSHICIPEKNFSFATYLGIRQNVKLLQQE